MSCPGQVHGAVQDQGGQPAPPEAHGHELLRRALRRDRGQEACDGDRSVGQGMAQEQHRRLRALPDRPQHPGAGDGADRNPQLRAPAGRRPHPDQDHPRFGHPPRAAEARPGRLRHAAARARVPGSGEGPQASGRRATPPTSSPTSARCRPIPIMANAKVRQALAYAVPYEEIHQQGLFGAGTSDQEHHAEDLPELHRPVLAVQDGSRQGARPAARGRLPRAAST